jgi:protein-disulfide isomerase
LDTLHPRPACGWCRAAAFFTKLLAVLTLGIGVEAARPALAQDDSQVLAVVDGKGITANEIDSSIVSQLLPLQQQIYALRKAALENLIIRAVLENEAKRQGVSVEELRKRLTAGSVEVSTSQVEQVYLEHAATFASMSPDEAKERLRLDLESQARMKNYRAALARLRQAASVEIRLEEPKLPQSVDDGTAPSLGLKESPVTIIEFSDFRCPYCREAQKTIKRIMQDYQGQVRLVFKHLPLGTHPQATASARAAFCAGRQGAFWQYHDALFGAEDLAPETLRTMASGLKLNLTEFGACLDSEAARAAVLADVREAKHLGVSGTPTFVVNGRLVRGAVSYDEFKATIERELQPARGTHR